MTVVRETTLRPSARAFIHSPFGRSWLVAFALSLLGAAGMMLNHPDAALVLAVLVLVLCTCAAISADMYLAYARIQLQDQEVRWRKVIRHGSFRLDQVKGFAYDPRRPLFVVADHRNRRLLRLHTGLWTSEALETLSAFLARSNKGST